MDDDETSRSENLPYVTQEWLMGSPTSTQPPPSSSSRKEWEWEWAGCIVKWPRYLTRCLMQISRGDTGLGSAKILTHFLKNLDCPRQNKLLSIFFSSKFSH